MATHSSFLPVFLTFLCLFHGCFSQQQQELGECMYQRVNALETMGTLQAEAGRTEFWDYNDQQFRCAGVAMVRHVIQPRGFLLSSYTNAPLLAYIVQGNGILGILKPGCPETFQSSQSQFERRQSFPDRHQKVENLQSGDIVAIVAGAAHWVYNEGNQELIIVVLQDTSNGINQLDSTPRRFFIAGHPGGGDRQAEERLHRTQGWGNVFRGIPVRTLRAAFNVSSETARRLRNENDQRGHIISIREGLRVLRPPTTRQEQQSGAGQGDSNGLGETICSPKIKQNIDVPARADVYNPQAGRFATVNSLTLPILAFLRLSAERGVLHRNAVFAPHWYVNANGVIYVTGGEARIQIADHRGETVFDGEVRRGQVVVVPQNYVIVKQAGNQGFEWVGFNTNDNAMINTIAGRTSAFRGLPATVLANGLGISEAEARQLKFNREETLIFPGSRPGRY